MQIFSKTITNEYTYYLATFIIRITYDSKDILKNQKLSFFIGGNVEVFYGSQNQGEIYDLCILILPKKRWNLDMGKGKFE